MYTQRKLLRAGGALAPRGRLERCEPLPQTFFNPPGQLCMITLTDEAGKLCLVESWSASGEALPPSRSLQLTRTLPIFRHSLPLFGKVETCEQ